MSETVTVTYIYLSTVDSLHFLDFCGCLRLTCNSMSTYINPSTLDKTWNPHHHHNSFLCFINVAMIICDGWSRQHGSSATVEDRDVVDSGFLQNSKTREPARMLASSAATGATIGWSRPKSWNFHLPPRLLGRCTQRLMPDMHRFMPAPSSFPTCCGWISSKRPLAEHSS